jgi:hypothetical protein
MMMKPYQSNKKTKTPKQTKKKGEKTRNKMEGLASKKTNEPPSRTDHKGNIKFLNHSLQEAHQIRKWEDLLKGHLA